MYIIKQRDRLILRYVLDDKGNWTDDPRKAKKWESKALATAYINCMEFKKCTLLEVASDGKIKF